MNFLSDSLFKLTKARFLFLFFPQYQPHPQPPKIEQNTPCSAQNYEILSRRKKNPTIFLIHLILATI